MAATRPVVKEKGDTFTYEGKNRTNNQSVRGDVVAQMRKKHAIN